MSSLKILGFSILILTLNQSWCQDTTAIPQEPSTSVAKKDTHSVKKAVIFSAVLPGLGQAYNRKWWKIPLIYGALGTLGYFAYDNHTKHRSYVDEYMNRQDNPNYLIPDEFINFDDQALITQHRRFQDNRDLMILGCVAVYAINLIDAAVDAHFYYFDISDDLSLRWQPQFSPRMTGISLGLYFHQNTTRRIRKPLLLE